MGHKPDSVTSRRKRRSSVCAARTRNSNAASNSSFPIWPCSGTGLPFRKDYSSRMRALTPPFHPYLTNQAVCFLLRFPFRGILSAASSCYRRSPCSVGSGLSSLQCKATAAPSPAYNIRLFSEKTNVIQIFRPTFPAAVAPCRKNFQNFLKKTLLQIENMMLW